MRRAHLRCLGPALFAVALGVAGCHDDPKRAVEAAVAAAARGSAADLEPWLHPHYADTLGDRDDLLRDVAALGRTHPAERFDARVARLTSEGASKRRMTAHLEADGAWGGEPSFRVTGPMPVTLEPWGSYRLRAGFLTDLRDAVQLTDAWARARRDPSPEHLKPLLHPAYDDAFVTRDEIAATWLEQDPVRARVTFVRLEVRDDLAHLDLHELVDADDGDRPVIHRLTLRPAAGRWRIASGLQITGGAHGGLAPADEVR